MKTHADVVIIGSGVQGLSTAYHLTKLGINNIAVVEKEFVGSGSSSRSASMLMMQRENEDKIKLSQYSYSEYMKFDKTVGVDIQFKKTGFLSVVPESVQEEALKRAKIRQQLAVRTDILNPKEIHELVPLVNVDDIAVGIYGPDDGVFNPPMIMQGYLSRAKESGASIEIGRRATGIEVKNHKVVGVHTDQGFISAPMVVNAAGAEAIEVGRWVGIDLPISNRVRSIFVTNDYPEIPDGSPMVEDAAVEWYFRKAGPTILIGMGKEDTKTISNSPNLKFLPSVLQFAKHRVPILANATIIQGWSGFRPLTPDLNPILGPVENVEGFINQCGWGGEGIMHAPAGGHIVASFIAGKNNSFDIHRFTLSRFVHVQ